MKKWVSKLIDQLDLDWSSKSSNSFGHEPMKVSEELATVLFILDSYNKHIMEIESHPVRRTRESLDEFSRLMIENHNSPNLEKILFKFRQFFTSYRIDEYSYIQKTFDEFRGIIWDFVDQLSEDFSSERETDQEITHSFKSLREAVEANSIDDLRVTSRQFIDNYIEMQTKKDFQKTERLESVRKNLHNVKKKLVEANHNMRRDHLTNAYNRKSFDEQLSGHWRLSNVSNSAITLMSLDIDHFKKINDTYGHPIGDFILVEFVKLLSSVFSRKSDFIARVGGEEFTIILPDYDLDNAKLKAQQILQTVRDQIFIHEGHELRFTVSIGLAQLSHPESIEAWLKRVDQALYESKQSGRDKFSVASPGLKNVA